MAKRRKSAQGRKSRPRGVPKGYVHRWRYQTGSWHEKKTGNNKWKFVWKSTKNRPNPGSGGPKKGYSIVWDIKGKQYATKVGPGTYLTTFRGEKTLSKVSKQGGKK